MSDSCKKQNESLIANNKLLREVVPDAMKAFGALGSATYPDGHLSRKYKEMVALAIGIAVRCEGCIAWHVMEAKRNGATREEVAELIALAIQMGGGPSAVYGGKALAGYDEFDV